MFERPTKGNLDRSLSLLMHEASHKLLDEINQIKSDAAKVGALHSNRIIVAVVKVAHTFHQDAMKQATSVLLDFIERMPRPGFRFQGARLSTSLLHRVSRPPRPRARDRRPEADSVIVRLAERRARGSRSQGSPLWRPPEAAALQGRP